MPSRRARVLLLADDHASHAETILEHIRAFVDYSEHDVRVFNPRGQPRIRALDLNEFDVVVIHYSLMVLSHSYVPEWLADRISRYRGVKVQFIQDDYRYVERMWERMRELGIDVLFTLVPEREIEKVWPERELPGVMRVTTLAGYVPEAAKHARTRDVDARPLDVAYRGRTLPAWVGILGQEKAWIARGFAERAPSYGLHCDVDWRESARIYGPSWFEFVASARATLGTESGATITDFNGTAERAVLEYRRAHPRADFWEIHRAVLEAYEGNVLMNVVSPRIFEAIALRTGLILFPGEYSNVIEPERHYIVLEKDFENFDEVVAQLRDSTSLRARIDRAYADIVAGDRYSYRQVARDFDRALDDLGVTRTATPLAGRPVRYHVARAERRLRAASYSRPTGKLRSMTRALSAARLVAGAPQTRKLLLRTAASHRLVGQLKTREVLDDLVRLAAVERAHRGSLAGGDVYTVFARHDPEGGTELVSAADLAEMDDRSDELEFPLSWNHTAIGETFVAPLTRRTWTVFPASSTPAHRHQFVGLERLAAARPGLLRDALSSLKGRPAAVASAPFVPKRGPLHVLRHLTHYTRKGVHLLEVLSRPEWREVFQAALHNGPRSASGVVGLMEDLGKLDAALHAVEGNVLDVRSVDASLADGVLRLRSRALRNGSIEPIDSAVCSIVWDHSEVGIFAFVKTRSGRVPYALLPDGRHEFPDLRRVLEEKPALAPAAFARLVDALQRRSSPAQAVEDRSPT